MDAKQVFEILVREHTPMLMAYLRACVRDTAAVDDLYQEVMLIAWRKLSDYQTDRSFAAWVRGIAGKLVLQHYRTAAQRHASFDPTALEWMEQRFAAIEAMPGDQFQQQLQMLRECISALPEVYRESVQMRYQQQLSLDTVSQQLSLSVETLKKRLVRARQRLSECLDRRVGLENG